MFTGIIREVGRIITARPSGTNYRLEVESHLFSKQAVIGESIAVDGVCLTVVQKSTNSIQFDATPETMERGIAKNYRQGTRVNLEGSLRMGDPLDGHMVQGHVDGVGTMIGWTSTAEGLIGRFRYPKARAGLIVEKGSIAINGVSLTVIDPGSSARPEFTVTVIPHTWEETNLKDLHPGGEVNLEFDVLGKYILRRIELAEKNEQATAKSGLTHEKLMAAGYVESR